MTTIADLPSDRIELNPGAPFPPFPIWLGVPSEWAQLDTNPGTWRLSAERLIDSTFHGSRLPAKDRRPVLAVVEELVADCQAAGAALSLLTLGRTTDGELASFGIHLAFAGDERPASLGRVQDMLPRSGTATEVDTGCGPGVLHRERITMMVPGTSTMKRLSSLQLFVPFPGTNWTAVLSTASAFPSLTAPLETLLRVIGTTIRLVDSSETGSDDNEAVERQAEPDEFVARPEPQAPGIERGFRTLVVKRIDPDGAPE